MHNEQRDHLSEALVADLALTKRLLYQLQWEKEQEEQLFWETGSMTWETMQSQKSLLARCDQLIAQHEQTIGAFYKRTEKT